MAALVFTSKIYGYNYDNLTSKKRSVAYDNYNKFGEVDGRKSLIAINPVITKKLTGTVFEKNAPVQRRLFVIAEDGLTTNGSPLILDSIVSSPVTGQFTSKIGNYSDRVLLVCMDAIFETNLVNGISANQTVIQITKKSPLNLNNIMLLIDSEIVQVVNGGDTTNLIVERAKKGTVAANHSAGALVKKIELESKVFSKVLGFE